MEEPSLVKKQSHIWLDGERKFRDAKPVQSMVLSTYWLLGVAKILGGHCAQIRCHLVKCLLWGAASCVFHLVAPLSLGLVESAQHFPKHWQSSFLPCVSQAHLSPSHRMLRALPSLLPTKCTFVFAGRNDQMITWGQVPVTHSQPHLVTAHSIYMFKKHFTKFKSSTETI